MSQSLYALYHYGWKRQEQPDSSEQSLMAVLLEGHTFLPEFDGQYRVEINRDDGSDSGRVSVYWEGGEPKFGILAPPLYPGDFWFTAFRFQVGDRNGCEECGTTGKNRYSIVWKPCWACGGTGEGQEDALAETV